MQRRVIRAQPCGDAGTKAFDQRIRIPRQAMQDGLARAGFQINGDAAFAAVAAAEERAHAVDEGRHLAGIIADARVLDFDDVRAEIAQQHGANSAGQETSQVQDADVGERLHEWSVARPRVAWQMA